MCFVCARVALETSQGWGVFWVRMIETPVLACGGNEPEDKSESS